MRIWPLPLKGEVTLHFLELASQRAQRGTLTVPAPPALRWTPHKPPALPLCMAGTEGWKVWKGWKVGRSAGRTHRQQHLIGLQDSSPHRTTTETGSATRSSGCRAIAQKGPAKAFCCAGDMMTADGGGGEAPVVSGLHAQKCPVQGIDSNRTIIHPAEVIGRMGRGENPRQGVFPWFWPIGNTLR